jgi:hypothetical protein
MSLRYVWAAEQQTAGDIHYGHRRGAQGRTQAIPRRRRWNPRTVATATKLRPQLANGGPLIERHPCLQSDGPRHGGVVEGSPSAYKRC